MGKEEQKVDNLAFRFFFRECVYVCMHQCEASHRLLELLFHHTDSN